MTKMAPAKLAAVQALSSAGFERNDYSFEKRARFTSIHFRYGITKEHILAKAEQLASALSVCLCPHSEEENYLMVYCHLPQESWPAGLYVVCQRALCVASLSEAATISRLYREQMQARRAARIAKLGYDNEWEVEQLELFGSGEQETVEVPTSNAEQKLSSGLDMRDIVGQAHVKRALEVAAAGGHNILLVGHPDAAGSLARTFPTIFPTTMPFREITPGVVDERTFLETLAEGQNGILFVNDLSSFDLSWLVTHLSHVVKEQLVAIARPCPCGFWGDRVQECTCSLESVREHRQRLREIICTCFAIEVEVPFTPYDATIDPDVLREYPPESSAIFRQRVIEAREEQQKRYAEALDLRVNADLRSPDKISQYCRVDSSGEKLIEAARRQLGLTDQELFHMQAVARTIADLSSSSPALIPGWHLAEAIQYRSGIVHDDLKR